MFRRRLRSVCKRSLAMLLVLSSMFLTLSLPAFAAQQQSEQAYPWQSGSYLSIRIPASIVSYSTYASGGIGASAPASQLSLTGSAGTPVVNEFVNRNQTGTSGTLTWSPRMSFGGYPSLSSYDSPYQVVVQTPSLNRTVSVNSVVIVAICAQFWWRQEESWVRYNPTSAVVTSPNIGAVPVQTVGSGADAVTYIYIPLSSSYSGRITLSLGYTADYIYPMQYVTGLTTSTSVSSSIRIGYRCLLLTDFWVSSDAALYSYLSSLQSTLSSVNSQLSTINTTISSAAQQIIQAIRDSSNAGGVTSDELKQILNFALSAPSADKSAADQFKQDMQEVTDKIDQAAQQIEQGTNRPDPSQTAQQVDPLQKLDPSDPAYMELRNGFSSVLQSEFMISILLMLFGFAFVSYVLFGKRV